MTKPLSRPVDWQGVIDNAQNVLDGNSKDNNNLGLDLGLCLDLDVGLDISIEHSIFNEIGLSLQGPEVETVPCSFDVLGKRSSEGEDLVDPLPAQNVPIKEEVNLVGATADESTAVEALRQLRGIFKMSDDKLVWCETCGYQFSSRAELEKHPSCCQLVSHQLHVCNVCKRSFARKSDLGNHIVSHQADRTHTCCICGGVYRRKADLQNHMVSHQTTRPHRCQECGADFLRPSSLTNHLKIHSYLPGRGMLGSTDIEKQCINLLEHAAAQLSTDSPIEALSTGIHNQHTSTDTDTVAMDSSFCVQQKPCSYDEVGETFYDCTNACSASVIGPNTNITSESLECPSHLSVIFPQELSDDRTNLDMLKYFEVPTVSANVDIMTSGQSDGQQCGVPEENKPQDSGSRIPLNVTNSTTVLVKMEPLPYDLDESMSQKEALNVETSDVNTVEPVEDVTKSANQNYSCSYCGEVFSREKALSLHLRIHQSECVECGKSFTDIDNLGLHRQHCVGATGHIDQLHLEDSSQSKPSIPTWLSKGKHTCTTCNKRFMTKQKLFRHMWVHRKKQFVCEVCGVNLNQREGLEEHRRVLHLGETRYVCQDCGRGFASRQGLWEHNRLHGNNSVSQYWCSNCNKTFSSRQGYLIHTRTHTGERPYGCRFCLKAFRDGGTLRKHERIHTGERPHVCPLCYRAFNQKVVLREHVRWVHAANRDVSESDADHLFICEICNHLLGDREELCAHIVKHSDDLAKVAKAQPNSSTVPRRPLKVMTKGPLKKQTPTKEPPNSPAAPVPQSAFGPAVRSKRSVHSSKTKAKHTCQMCDETFVEKKQLLMHVRIHI